MSEPDPTEHVNEELAHHGHSATESWIAGAALTAAILAALAAISGSLAGQQLTQSGREQIHSNDQWGFYQAKSIKAAILRSKGDVLAAMGKEPPASDASKLAEYERDLDAIKGKAEQADRNSESHLHRHEVLERGVTLFHISIAVAAISVLVRRRAFWYAAIACGLVGVVFLGQGLMAH